MQKKQPLLACRAMHCPTPQSGFAGKIQANLRETPSWNHLNTPVGQIPGIGSARSFVLAAPHEVEFIELAPVGWKWWASRLSAGPCFQTT
jgi:hypothetical protein